MVKMNVPWSLPFYFIRGRSSLILNMATHCHTTESVWVKIACVWNVFPYLDSCQTQKAHQGTESPDLILIWDFLSNFQDYFCWDQCKSEEKYFRGSARGGGVPSSRLPLKLPLGFCTTELGIMYLLEFLFHNPFWSLPMLGGRWY